MTNAALGRYRDHAERLGKKFLDLSSEQVLAAVSDYLPNPPANVLDVGAGSGRDAARFVREGHRVTAVEPVAEISALAKALPEADQIEWVSDQLPELATLKNRAGTFDLALLSGVWHHLDQTDRARALETLATLLAPGGRLLISLRIGGETDNRTIFPIDPETTVETARDAGLTLLHRAPRPSIQQDNINAGVTWEWFVLEREGTQ